MENTKTIKLSMFLEVDANAANGLKRLTHHVDELLNLDEYPEIKTVYGVKVTEIES